MNLSQAWAGAVVNNTLDLLNMARDTDITDEDWEAAMALLKETAGNRSVLESEAAEEIIDLLTRIRKFK